MGYAIEVKDVKKDFKVYVDRSSNLKDFVIHAGRRKYEIRRVLDGVSFQAKKGEAIGLIGHNGCGKSTMLKMLSRIIYPDSVSIQMHGRVSSLIELGAGFHPDMSGRENIYINASILGLSKKEIDRRLDSIISFSELGQFMDNPVRTYSSGMYMRLAFSVAISVDADILLIDEILAVGDAAFQVKCFNKLQDVKAKGTTIILVSHSMGQIEQLCDRSIWIHDGKIREEGAPREISPLYLLYMEGNRMDQGSEVQDAQSPDSSEGDSSNANENSPQENKDPSKRWGNGKAHIEEIHMNTAQKTDSHHFKTGEDIEIRIKYSVFETITDAVIGIGIFRTDGLQCYGTNTRIDRLDQFDLAENGEVSVQIHDCKLLSGNYLLDVAIESGHGIPVDYYREAYSFQVTSVLGDVGVSRMAHQWKMNGSRSD